MLDPSFSEVFLRSLQFSSHDTIVWNFGVLDNLDRLPTKFLKFLIRRMIDQRRFGGRISQSYTLLLTFWHAVLWACTMTKSVCAWAFMLSLSL